MNKILQFFIAITLFFTALSAQAQRVNINSKINGFRHNHDCCSDGTVFGCVLGSQPEPRYKVWVGYNGANFMQSNNGPGLQCGSPNFTYGADAEDCSFWNPGIITLPAFSGVTANSFSVDMLSWESDAGLPCCINDNCNPNGSASAGGILCGFGLIPCLNPDDVSCGRTRIGDVNYWVNPPDCIEYTWTGDFTSGSFLSMAFRCGDENGAGYGIDKLNLSWGFFDAPSITLQPSDASVGGAVRTSCINYPPPTFTFSVNLFKGWSLGRNVRWEKASNPGGPWTIIPGTTVGPNDILNTYSYTPPAPGGAVTEYYRAVVSSDCGNTFIKSTITNTVTVNWLASSNASCIPATCNTVYVDPNPGAGSDVIASGAGSAASPYQTISYALSKSPQIIRVAKGAGTDATVCNLIDNVIIEGGYVRSGGNWEKSSAAADATTITFSGTEQLVAPATNIRHLVAFKSNTKTGWAVKDINITTSNVLANQFAQDGAGLSNYGFLINNSSDYLISRCNISVGNAGKGRNGTTPATGGGASGGAGGNGSTGCRGGEGSKTAPVGSSGIIGGGIGSPVLTNGGAAVFNSWDCNSLHGGTDGKPGSAGANGTPGTTGAVGSAYILNAPYFTPGTNGADGVAGGGGQGGGGGSGAISGNGCLLCDCISCPVPAGRNGGAGGQGGTGGSGGGSGGGAFGIWRYLSSSGAVLTELNISTLGAAGAIGTGAQGSNGVSGTIPVTAACDGCSLAGFGFDQHCAGDGGTGGTGGKGGTGGNGIAGTNGHMVTDGTISNPSVSVVSPNSIFVDYYSKRIATSGTITGLACRNSEIDLRTTISAPSWSFSPAGLTIVNDLRDLTVSAAAASSYNLTQSSIKVTTNSSNLFYDLTVGTTFKNGLYVKAQTPDRTLPVIANMFSEICEGGTVTNTVTGWDEPNVLKREWLVYDSALVASNPASPLFTQTTKTPVFGTFPIVGTYRAYIIRYRELHSCCGWSRPVFGIIRVFPLPTKPNVIPNPNKIGICPLTPVSATFTPGSLAVGCSFIYEYMRDGSGIWNTYIPGDTLKPMSGNTAIAIRSRKICTGSGGQPNVTANCDIDLDSTYEWSVLQTVNRGSLEIADQTDLTALCGTPTPTANGIVFITPPAGAGGFTYQWYYKDLAGTTPPPCPASLESTAGWTVAPGATATLQAYAPGSGEVPAGHSRTYAVWVTPNNGGGASDVCGVADWAINCRKITVLAAFNIGTLTSADETGANSFCANAGSPPDPDDITFSTAPTGSGAFRYQWYYKVNSTTTPDNCPSAASDTLTWIKIAGATSSNYNPAQGEVLQGTSRTYACFVTPTAASGSTLCGTGAWANGCRKITVLPTFNIGTLVSGDQSLCDNATVHPTPNSITFSSLPVGSGSFSYQWYYQQLAGTTAPNCPASGSGIGGWTSLGAANGGQTATYSPASNEITGGNSRTYACFVTPTAGTSLICGAGNWASGCRKIVMNAAISYGTLTGTPTTQCSPAALGYTGTVVSFTGAVGDYTWQWYYRDGDFTPPAGTNNTTGWTPIAGTNSNSYTAPTGLTATRSYSATLTPNINCGGELWTTGRFIINVLNPATIIKGSINTTGDTICVGGTPPRLITFSTAPSAPTGITFSVRWCRIPRDTTAPTPGSTVQAPWITANTSTITPPTVPSYAPTNAGVPATPGYICYAAMVDQTGTPNCDAGYQWVPGIWKVRVVADPLVPNGTPIPAPGTYCTGQQFTVSNTSQGVGGISPYCSLEYATSFNSTTPGVGGLAFSPNIPTITSSAIGPYRIFIRTNCGGVRGCGSTSGLTAATRDSVILWTTTGTAVTWTPATGSNLTICTSGSVDFSTVTASRAGTITWYRATTPLSSSGTPVTFPDIPPGTGTYYYRPLLNTSGAPVCPVYGPENTVIVVDDPDVSTATKSPADAIVCSGAVLTLTSPVQGAGGAGVCALQYQISASPLGLAGWGASIPSIISGPAGTYTIEVRTNCDGTGCNASAATSYSWTVVDDPAITAVKSPNTALVCEGANLTITGGPTSGGTGNCTAEYQTITPLGGTSAWSSTLPTITGAALGTNTLNARFICDGLGCGATVSRSFTWTVVADPAAPTATKSPNVLSVCEGATLSLTGVTTPAGGTGTCVTEYSVNGGAFSTSFSPFTATVGTNTVAIRRNCDGTDCDISTENIYSWIVAADPIAPTATKVPNDNTVCVGQFLNLSGVTDLGGGTGSCDLEYSVDGGTNWTSFLTPYAAVLGSNSIKVRKSCSGSGCGIAENTYTWTAVAQPGVPTGLLPSPNVPDVCEGQMLSLTGVPAGVGGTGTCIFEYSANGGPYTSTLTPFAAIVGTNTVNIRRNCDGSGCNVSIPLTISWTGYEDPAAPDATQSPVELTVCSGSVLSLTGIIDNGGGIGTCNTLYQTVTPSGTSLWSAVSPFVTTTTPGTYTINIRKYCNGNDCDSSSISAYSWTVVADPTLAVLPNITYCKGFTSTKNLRSTVTGGSGTYNFIWQYSPDNITWYTIPGANDPAGISYSISSSSLNSSLDINGDGTEAAGNYYYKCLVSSSTASTACNINSNVSTITVVNKPIITNPVPATQTACLNTVPTDLTATASLGSASPYSYSWYIDSVNITTGGVLIDSVNPITPSTADTGTFYYYVVLTQPESGCADTSNTTAQVVIIDAPRFDSVKTPNLPGVCEGTAVSGTLSFVGGTGCTDVFQKEYDNSGVWITYTSGDTISTVGHTQIRIRAIRGSCGCASPYHYLSWSINDKPDASSAVAVADVLCGSISLPYANLSANNPAPYTGIWSIKSGPGTVENPGNYITRIINMTPGSPTIVRWLADNSGCSDSLVITVTPTNTVLDLNTIAVTDNCRNCTIRNGNVYTFFNASGHIVAKIEDFTTPATELALTEVCLDMMPYTPTTVPTVYTSMADLQPYLPRRWSISPTTTPSASHVTLYFKQAEFDALQTAAVGTKYAFTLMTDLSVTKFNGGSGGTMTNPPVFPALDSSAVLLSTTVKKYPSLINGPDYSVEFDVSNYSTFYVHPNSFPFAPLPVELLSFTGWNQDNINVLNWVTASESNTKKFEIQKSMINSSGWVTIGEKAAAGYSTQQISYDFDDLNPVMGNNYYKLKITDNDGSFSFSNTINIPVSQAVVNDFTRVYPNPTTGQLNVEIQSTAEYDTRIILYDVIGMKVSDKLTAINKGINKLQFDFSLLAKGAYVLQFSDAGGTVHKTKFVKD